VGVRGLAAMPLEFPAHPDGLAVVSKFLAFFMTRHRIETPPAGEPE